MSHKESIRRVKTSPRNWSEIGIFILSNHAVECCLKPNGAMIWLVMPHVGSALQEGLVTAHPNNDSCYTAIWEVKRWKVEQSRRLGNLCYGFLDFNYKSWNQAFFHAHCRFTQKIGSSPLIWWGLMTSKSTTINTTTTPRSRPPSITPAPSAPRWRRLHSNVVLAGDLPCHGGASQGEPWLIQVECCNMCSSLNS